MAEQKHLATGDMPCQGRDLSRLPAPTFMFAPNWNPASSGQKDPQSHLSQLIAVGTNSSVRLEHGGRG